MTATRAIEKRNAGFDIFVGRKGPYDPTKKMKFRKTFTAVLYLILASAVTPQTALSRDFSIDAFQLHGAMRLQDQWRFSIKNHQIDQSFWLKLGSAPVNGFKALEYDPHSETLKVAYRGARHELQIAQPSTKAIEVVRSRPVNTVPTVNDIQQLPPVPTKKPPPPPNDGRPPEEGPPATPPRSTGR